MDVTSELAAALEAGCTEVLGSHQRALDELGGPITEDPVARQRTTAHAGQLWLEVLEPRRPAAAGCCAIGSRVRNGDRPGGCRLVSGA
jgi:hypothetical protein